MIDVIGYLQKKGVPYKITGAEAHLKECLFCHGEKFFINTVTGAWKCFSENKCGQSGNLYTLKRRLGDAVESATMKRNYQQPKPAGHTPEETVFQWFATRQIMKTTVDRFGITQHCGEIIFPYFRNGILVNNKYRTRDKKFRQERDAEPCLYGRDLVPDESAELIIVEGEIDALTISQTGFLNVVSVPSGAGNLDWIETSFDYLDSFETIFLCFDQDRAGQEAALKIAKRLGYRCKRVKLPFKDANDWLMHGMTKAMLQAALDAAQPMKPEKIKLAEEFFNNLLDDDEHGLKTGFDKFDRILGGFRPGEVTVLTGRNGDGKSTFVNQLTLQMLKKYSDLRICISSFEMRPKSLLRWMMYQADLPLSIEGMETFGKITGGRLSFIDTQNEISPEDLLECFEYLAQRSGVFLYIIDSLMRVNLGAAVDWLEAQKRFMNSLLQFALKYECHLILLAHPRKSTSDSARIDKVDVAGSYDVTNLAYNVVSIRRIAKPKDGEPPAALEVLKNRIPGTLGTIPLDFNERTKNFSEVEAVR